MEFLDRIYYGNSVLKWGIAVLVGGAALLLLNVIFRVAAGRFARLAERSRNEWDDLLAQGLKKTRQLFLFVAAIYVASRTLTLPEGVRGIFTRVAVVALILQGGIWASAAVASWLDGYRKRRLGEDAAAATRIGALGFLGKLVLWSVVVILVLDNLGVDITALIAGLGVGGIAVALAVQSILGDLFASLSIVLDKPFVIGDFLILGDSMGSVEQIGLKTTRLRSLSGEQLIISNADLLASRIRNYGRMYERRVVFTIGVAYETPREKIIGIPAIIREAVETHEQVRFDRSHFKSYGDFALDFETVYYVLVADYNIYMDIQQAINLRIHERFEEQGIEFAYPTQKLFVVKEDR
ncbi:MAG: mechanosensitive ion channel family protein [Planctomycetota bacterium]